MSATALDRRIAGILAAALLALGIAAGPAQNGSGDRDVAQTHARHA